MAEWLPKLIDEPRVVFPVASRDKDAVLEELIGHLVCLHSPPVAQRTILDGIRRREEDFSTGIGRGVAIPHVELEGNFDPMAVVGVADPPIEYDAIDGNPVRFLFCLVCSDRDRKERLSILAEVSQLLANRELFEELEFASSANEVARIFRGMSG